MVAHYASLQNNDKCVQAIYFPTHYGMEQLVEMYDDDDGDDYGHILGLTGLWLFLESIIS
jgi:hypothetical protein